MPNSAHYSRAPIRLPDESCAAFVERARDIWGDRSALVFEDKAITFRSLADRVASVKTTLKSVGLQRGARLGVAMATTPSHITWILAALELGIAVVPIQDSAPAAELRAKCLAARLEAVVVDSGVAERRRAELSSLTAPPPILVAANEHPPVAASLDEDVGPSPHRGDVALLPFSSGTTGEPKLVLLSHGNVLAARLLFAQATRLHSRSTLVHFLPLSHIYGWMALTAALASGARVVLHGRYNFDQLVDDVDRHQATAVFAIPQTIINLSRGPGSLARRIRSLRWVNTGAAPLAPAVIREVTERFRLTVTSGYGLTEAAPVSHSAVECPDLISVDSVGFPVANTRLGLIDPDDPNRPLKNGSAGELTIEGPQVTLGYLRGDGSLDRDAWRRDSSFRTGDLVEFDSQGRLRIVGRIKNVIKYKGYSVSPAELEALLAEHPAVRDCAVVGHMDSDVGEIPTAFVVSRSDSPPGADELIAYVRERVAPHRRVRKVIFVREIPRTHAGKVLTKELLKKA